MLGPNEKYWLTPKSIYEDLNKEFNFTLDPCPYPKPENYNSLEIDWSEMNFVNPPFRKLDAKGLGPTKFVRKAIEQSKLGKSSFLILPVQSYVNLLLEAGSIPRSLGRIKWIEVNTGKEYPTPQPICGFYLEGKK